MRFFLKFISCVRRIVLKQFQNDSDSLKVRKIKGGNNGTDLPHFAHIKKNFCYIYMYIYIFFRFCKTDSEREMDLENTFGERDNPPTAVSGGTERSGTPRKCFWKKYRFSIFCNFHYFSISYLIFFNHFGHIREIEACMGRMGGPTICISLFQSKKTLSDSTVLAQGVVFVKPRYSISTLL